VGYALANGRAEMVDFWALVTNGHVFVQFPHVITGAMATAAFFVLGISAWHLARARDASARDAFRRSFRLGAVYALVSSMAVMVVGHGQAQYMIRIQPMKMAAAEALWHTENPAAMSLFTWGDEAQQRDVYSIRVPGLLSFLAHNRFEGEVKGIRELQTEYERAYGPGEYSPPVKWTYWTFRLMVGAGSLMFLFGAWATFSAGREREVSPGLLALLVPAIGLPYLANSTGWLFTELGRQPWIVFGLQKTAAGVSPAVSVGELLVTLIGFTAIYGALMGADIYLLRKYATRGLAAEASALASGDEHA
jgi:cytochrome bd ubiquinol oxidase subunit I